MRQGIALVLSAPSGAGKSTLAKRLCHEFPAFGYSVSCTTRPMRQGEAEGVDYFFVSREEFEKMRASGQFAEWAEVHGNLYGTPIAPVRTMLKSGIDVLFDIDVQGAAQLKSTLPEATFAFILPPCMAELESRLAKRAANTQENMALRLKNAIAEMREAYWYDVIIVNDDIEEAFANLAAVYRAATLAPACNRAFMEKLMEEAETAYGKTDSGA